MSIRHVDHVVASTVCRACGGRGWEWDWDGEGHKVTRPCPDCQRRDPDEQTEEFAALRRRVGRADWRDPRVA